MRQQTPFVRRLRLAILAALALSIAGVIGLYFFGRAGQTSEPAHQAAIDPEATGKDAKIVGKGFDYTVTHGDVPAFRIRGERVRSDKDDNVDLEKVGLTFFRESKPQYELLGEQASYNRESRAASISGLVRVTGPNGLELHAEQLALSPGGQSLQSVGPVSFRLAESYTGDANELHADLATDTLALRNGVKLQTDPKVTPAMSLEALRIELDRVAGIARAEGGVELRRGANSLTAQRLICQLEPDGHNVKEVNLRGQVTGVLGGAAADPTAPAMSTSTSTTEFSGDRLTLGFVPETKDPSTIELEGTQKGVARLESKEKGETRSWMTAPLFTGQFIAGQLGAAQGIGGIVIEEPDNKGTTRRATAQRADATFQAGRLSNVTLQGDVELTDPKVRASGDRAYYDMTAKRAELFGQDARATSERGDLRAPHLVYNQANGLLRADGGVKGLIRPENGKGLAGTPLARGEGPIRIESTEATWQDSPRTFFFKGAVRAWRGSNLLACDQLQGNEDTGVVSASGGVKSVWVPEPKSGANAKNTAPIEVNADTLVYHREQHTAAYSGNVRLRQETRTLTCDEANVDLDADNRAKKMRCIGNVKMEDPEANRRATGTNAEYDVDSKSLEMQGNPVEVTDPIHGKATGRRLLYDVGTGKMRLLAIPAQPDPPAPVAAAPPAAIVSPAPPPPVKPPSGRSRNSPR